MALLLQIRFSVKSVLILIIRFRESLVKSLMIIESIRILLAVALVLDVSSHGLFSIFGNRFQHGHGHSGKFDNIRHTPSTNSRQHAIPKLQIPSFVTNHQISELSKHVTAYQPWHPRRESEEILNS